MNTTNTLRVARGPMTVALSVILSIVLVVAIAEASTTISTNISTGGTLSVTGASTLTGNVTASGTLDVSGLTTLGQASSTRLSVFDTSYFGGTATSTFDSAGNLSVAGTADVTGASTLSSTLTVSGLTSLGQASSTRLSVFDTAYFGGTATSTFSSAGALTLVGDLSLTTASSTGLVKVDSLQVSSGGDTVADLQFGTCTVTIGSIAVNQTVMATCTATGVTTNHEVFVTPYITDDDVIMTSASSTAADTIQIAVYNASSTAAVDPADNSWSWMGIR